MQFYKSLKRDCQQRDCYQIEHLGSRLMTKNRQSSHQVLDSVLGYYLLEPCKPVGTRHAESIRAEPKCSVFDRTGSDRTQAHLASCLLLFQICAHHTCTV